MIRNRTISTLTTAVALVALSGAATPARAGQVSDARLRELIKQAADRASTGDAGAQQPVAAAAGDTRPVVRLTLEEAVAFALERNLDIAVQRLNPEINDIAIASISSVYHPSLTSIDRSAEHDGAADQPDHGRLGRHRAAEQDDDGQRRRRPADSVGRRVVHRVTVEFPP